MVSFRFHVVAEGGIFSEKGPESVGSELGPKSCGYQKTSANAETATEETSGTTAPDPRTRTRTPDPTPQVLVMFLVLFLVLVLVLENVSGPGQTQARPWNKSCKTRTDLALVLKRGGDIHIDTYIYIYMYYMKICIWTHIPF